MSTVLLSMPFFRRNWGEVKYNLSRVTQLIVIEDLHTSFCDAKPHPHNHYALQT